MRALTLHPRHEAVGIVTRVAPLSSLKVADAAIRLTAHRKGSPRCSPGFGPLATRPRSVRCDGAGPLLARGRDRSPSVRLGRVV